MPSSVGGNGGMLSPPAAALRISDFILALSDLAACAAFLARAVGLLWGMSARVSIA